ncbi:methylated-DNA--[protein]-cysteine S-methyltransferase [Chelatococcus reniformis]|uniref:methylated-DNA--[protein]-cysteine S-methyltransferase n=1 Tax=Chelatococcus reniformis TaxID=1494448 RepID=A0A916UIT6_9HYPH|nr:methylated-DNA--[protein]-cysteine S-methyltransferase [Chelatococcus reniformis]GGC73356.1 methylated-DNA--[protein]-cysteine S-methyltransferase [Chelatococcus reniformis]
MATASAGYHLFDTAIGQCGLAWGAAGLTRVALPEHSEAASRARLLRQHPDIEQQEPPPAVAAVVADIVALLAGEAKDLAHAVLDLAGVPDFNARVYATTRAIRPGETLTYGEVAARIGEPAAAQAVGRALGANPFPIVVPCHRVLARGGKAHGFSAHGGIATKARMLAIEGAPIDGGPNLFGDLPYAAKPKPDGEQRRG